MSRIAVADGQSLTTTVPGSQSQLGHPALAMLRDQSAQPGDLFLESTLATQWSRSLLASRPSVTGALLRPGGPAFS